MPNQPEAKRCQGLPRQGHAAGAGEAQPFTASGAGGYEPTYAPASWAVRSAAASLGHE